MRRNVLYPDRKMVDPKMKANFIDSRYIGVFRLKKDDSVVRLNFTTNAAASRKSFEAAWKSREYVSGLMAHTRLRWTGYYKSRVPRKLARYQVNHDVWALYAEYAQKKFDLFKGEGNRDEKSAGSFYTTVKQLKEKKQELIKKVKDSFKGSGDRLNRGSLLYYITYDKKYQKLSYGHWRTIYSMKTAYASLGTTLSNFVYSNYQQRYSEDIAWLIIDRFYGPQQCSEKEFSDPNCRIMLGYALRQQWCYAHKNVTDIRLPANSEHYQYFTLTWNYEKPDSKVEKTFLGRNMANALKAQKRLVTGADRKFTTAIMQHTK